MITTIMAALLCALASGLRHFFKDKEEVEEKEELKTEEHEIKASADKEKLGGIFMPWRPFEVKFVVFSVHLFDQLLKNQYSRPPLLGSGSEPSV